MSEIAWFNSRQGQAMYHYSKASRPGLECIQFHIQWFRGYFLEERQLDYTADCSSDL
jgi:hypothetical protein